MVLLLAKKDDLGHSTKCVHIGGRADTAYGSLVTPIYQTTTYEIPSMADLIDINVHGTKKAHQYSSSSNPTQRAAELKIAALEGVEDALVFSGGMAAITSTILTYVEKGDEILAQKDLYSTTGRLFKEIDAGTAGRLGRSAAPGARVSGRAETDPGLRDQPVAAGGARHLPA